MERSPHERAQKVKGNLSNCDQKDAGTFVGLFFNITQTEYLDEKNSIE
jgi:hypothetical protein